MKKSNSHLHLTWKLALSLHVPIRPKRAALIANRVVIATCLLSLTLSLVPLIGLLLAGS